MHLRQNNNARNEKYYHPRYYAIESGRSLFSTSTRLHGVTSQEIVLFIVTSVRISSLSVQCVDVLCPLMSLVVERVN